VPAPTAAPARPACVSRLRIAGFKTFADPVALDVPPGLVGPNGCGKSNVVDALRWAMGEGSARTLRGAEMDDVIFAGTAARPGRGRGRPHAGRRQLPRPLRRLGSDASMLHRPGERTQ